MTFMTGFGVQGHICVLKMNEGLTGLKRHEGDKMLTDLEFLGELSL